MEIELIDLLKRAKQRIQTSGKLAKERMSLDINGNYVSPKNENAVCWCCVGALEAEETNAKILNQATDVLFAELPENIKKTTYHKKSSIYQFSDQSTVEDIINLYTKAIEKEETK